MRSRYQVKIAHQERAGHCCARNRSINSVDLMSRLYSQYKMALACELTYLRMSLGLGSSCITAGKRLRTVCHLWIRRLLVDVAVWRLLPDNHSVNQELELNSRHGFTILQSIAEMQPPNLCAAPASQALFISST